MAELILIDINILGIGSMREYEYQYRRHRGRETGAIHGAFSKLSRLLGADRAKVPVVLWDDRCRWREEILPQYKRHRWNTPEQQAFLKSYLRQAKVIRTLLSHLGVPQASCPNFEADDLAGLICRHLDPSWPITLATTDTDWYQALRPNVVWQSTRGGYTIREADLKDPDSVASGPFFSTDHYIQAKALAGDSSDGIPGVNGVGLKTAARIIAEHGTIEALWAKHDAGEPLKGVVLQRAAGPEHRDIYYRNLRLIDWRLAPRLHRKFRVEHEQASAAEFKSLCEKWGLEGIATSWKGFTLPRRHAASAVKQLRTIFEAAAAKANDSSRDRIVANKASGPC
jgi:DNA polymerase-1